ncbi:SAM-dependent methyltransferase [Chaetomidium leptoderma]|uniref:SAM-dependent methyltransferase n=1 Tax=Chaetomidium leptoderma TaxID=669021 RepID=A0AAN6ZT11_9PEZI|nr:SAM-dependent methyltransferase [Chaetomidium leptoderma]
MDDTLAEARYAKLIWNAPLAESHADELLNHLNLGSDTSIVDLGCGWGELLLRAAARNKTDVDGVPVTGVDTDVAALRRGRQAAQDRGVDVSFVEQQAQDWRGTRNRAICVGSSHTLGGGKAMLGRLAEIVPRGRVLVGDMCWERPPTEAARAIFGDDVPLLADLVGMCRETGWEVLHLSTADQREWDDFESRHRAGLREWLLANPDSPQAQIIREQQDAKEREYLTGYRGVLGFVYLVLGR